MPTRIREEQEWLATVSLVVLAFVAIAFSLAYTRAIMVPFVLAIFVVTIVSPVVDYQVLRWKVPRWIAMSVAFLMVLSLLSVVGLFLTSAVQTVVKTAASYSASLTTMVDNVLPEPVEESNEPIEEDGAPNESTEPGVPAEGSEGPTWDGEHSSEEAATGLDSLPPEPDAAATKAVVNALPANPVIDPTGVLPPLTLWGIPFDKDQVLVDLRRKMPPVITHAAGTVAGLVSNGFLIVIFVIFLLAGRDSHKVSRGIYAEIESKIRRYLATKLAVSTVTGLAVWLILTLFDMPMASMFAMLTFLLNFIPSIGSIIATLLPIPVAVMNYDNPWVVVAVIAIPGAVQMVIGNIIEPKLMGQGLELHPVTILFSLAFWGLLWGPIGMVLAVPITATVRIVLMRFITTRPIGNLLAGQLPQEAEALP